MTCEIPYTDRHWKGGGDFWTFRPEVPPVMTGAESRELTREERAAIKKLVTRDCANYDREYGCLPLDCPCYMLGKWWTGAYCKYFQSAVLPLDPVLEAALTGSGPVPEAHACPVCGRPFAPQGKRTYCSPACQRDADRKKARDRMRKKRSGGTG